MNKREIILIVHNIRSTHNVGSLLRTADGLNLSHVYLTGYTPYPKSPHDLRLPHLAQKIDRQISKTALGAEKSVPWSYVEKIEQLIELLKNKGYMVAALEQTDTAESLGDFKPPDKIALLLGNEVEGIDTKTLELVDKHLEIPMLGKKESFNVAAAAAMALYRLRFFD